MVHPSIRYLLMLTRLPTEGLFQRFLDAIAQEKRKAMGFSPWLSISSMGSPFGSAHVLF
jgi:hypothetical protein